MTRDELIAKYRDGVQTFKDRITTNETKFRQASRIKEKTAIAKENSNIRDFILLCESFIQDLEEMTEDEI